MQIIPVRLCEQIIPRACLWFAQKWGIAQSEYEQSMRESIARNGIQEGLAPSKAMKQKQNPNAIHTIPQWYVVLEGDEIIAGAGVIENDFHSRKDLSPNVCALYVEQDHRKMGVARALLEFIRKDMHGYKRLYLVTDHMGFYEKCGWKYVCDVDTDDGEGGRIYEIETEFEALQD